MSRLGPPPSTPPPEFGGAPGPQAGGPPMPGGPMQGTPTPMAAPASAPSGKDQLNAGDIIEITIRLKNLSDRNPQAVPQVATISQNMRDLQTILTAAAPPVEVAAPPI